MNYDPYRDPERETIDPRDPYKHAGDSDGSLSAVALGAIVLIALGGFIYFYSSRTGPDVAATDMRAPITQKAPAETTGSGSGGDTPMPPAKPVR